MLLERIRRGCVGRGVVEQLLDGAGEPCVEPGAGFGIELAVQAPHPAGLVDPGLQDRSPSAGVAARRARRRVVHAALGADGAGELAGCRSLRRHRPETRRAATNCVRSSPSSLSIAVATHRRERPPDRPSAKRVAERWHRLDRTCALERLHTPARARPGSRWRPHARGRSAATRRPEQPTAARHRPSSPLPTRSRRDRSCNTCVQHSTSPPETSIEVSCPTNATTSETSWIEH